MTKSIGKYYFLSCTKNFDLNRKLTNGAVVGTASTMAYDKSLGMSLPHNAAIPASDARRKVLGFII